MIRIDLGKDGLQKKSAIANLRDLYEKFRTTGFKARGPKGTKIQFDLKGVVIIGVVTAIACLPHLFVAQYRSYIEAQHASQMRVLQEKQEGLRQEIAKYESYQRELESYEKQKKLIQDRLSIVRQLLESRGTPVSVLDSVGQSLPQRSWLTGVEYRVAPDPGVTLAGQAYSNEDISDFVDKLSESIHLGDVALENVAVTREGKDLEVKVFEVKAKPKGLFTEAPKAEVDPERATANAATQAPNPSGDQ